MDKRAFLTDNVFERNLSKLIFVLFFFESMQNFYFWLKFDQFYSFVLAFASISAAFDVYLRMEHGKR